MPRDDSPTPLRRLMMQSIMWLILGATVGAAAMVSHFKRQSLKPPLGEPQKVQEISVRLPIGWEDPESRSDERALFRSHPQFGDVLVVTVRQIGFGELLNSMVGEPEARPSFVKEIDLGGEKARLMLIQYFTPTGTILELRVSRALPKNRVVSISIGAKGVRGRSDLAPEMDLIERVAASVKVDANY